MEDSIKLVYTGLNGFIVPSNCGKIQVNVGKEGPCHHSDGVKTSKIYPEKLRRIKYVDGENNKTLVFLTNNFSLPPSTVAELFRFCW